MLCLPGFVDDIMVSHNGADGAESSVALCFVEFGRWRHRGRSLMFMIDCFVKNPNAPITARSCEAFGIFITVSLAAVNVPVIVCTTLQWSSLRLTLPQDCVLLTCLLRNRFRILTLFI